MQSNWSLPQSSTRVAPEAYNQHFSTCTMYTDHAAYWDGRTETGATVSSGTYFYQLKAEDYADSRKMVILISYPD